MMARPKKNPDTEATEEEKVDGETVETTEETETTSEQSEESKSEESKDDENKTAENEAATKKYKLANPNTSYSDRSFSLYQGEEKELPDKVSSEVKARIKAGQIVEVK